SLLQQHQADVNARDKMNGETALHHACEKGYDDIIRILLDHGADLSLEDVYRKTPMHY
ncbi:hypothetical protein GUITHDRAFT_40304, partial [Guillardia theta CCMP2712]